VNLAAFRARYPEFGTGAAGTGASDALVTAALADAADTMDAAVWGTRYDQGHGLLTAHILSLAPNAARGARVQIPGQTPVQTGYGQEWMRIAQVVSPGWYRVL